MSPTATPGKNKKRLYTSEDMQVLALVSQLKDQDMSDEDIHVALANGDRGAAPELEPNELQMIATTGKERQLSIEVDTLRRQVIRLREQLQAAEEVVNRVHETEVEIAKVKATLDATEKHHEETRTELQTIIDRLTKKVEELSREVGKSYHEGYMDALKTREDD